MRRHGHLDGQHCRRRARDQAGGRPGNRCPLAVESWGTCEVPRQPWARSIWAARAPPSSSPHPGPDRMARPVRGWEAAASGKILRPAGGNRTSKEKRRQKRAPPSTPQEHMTHQPSDMADAPKGATMDCILQEISTVGRRLEGMDSRMISLTEETKSMHLDFAGFQSRVTTLEQRVTAVETQATLTADRDQELLYLCRDSVCFLGFPEEIEGADVQSFLKNILPQLTVLAFDPPLEFQRAHRLGPKSREGANHPRPIIACFL
ncbi:hypothetical protein NDU88_003610 [Pleurodeles waltl]|uniref:Uncharacterized protein n=1 Tax=Pleurodeles waltl TaxID=8319 RepID=A0AAV7V178_PLEWA|nr:hypothetical protein NDU88_003610 [Pleurodeles waltl]